MEHKHGDAVRRVRERDPREGLQMLSLAGGNGQECAGAVRDPAEHQREGRAKCPLLLVGRGRRGRRAQSRWRPSG